MAYPMAYPMGWAMAYPYFVLTPLRYEDGTSYDRYVNLLKEACAHQSQTRVLAVLVSSRTTFSLFCRRLENVSILGLFLRTIRSS